MNNKSKQSWFKQRQLGYGLIVWILVAYGLVHIYLQKEESQLDKEQVVVDYKENTGGSMQRGLALDASDEQIIRLRRSLPVVNTIFRVEYDYERFHFIVYSHLPEELVRIQLQQWLQIHNFYELGMDDFVYRYSEL